MDGIVILILSVALAALGALFARSIVRMRRAMRRFQVLSQIAQASDRGGSLHEALDSICEIIVPEVADFCMIDLVKGDRVERIAVRVGPGGGQKAVEGLAGRQPSMPADMSSAGFSERADPAALLRADERRRPRRHRPRRGGPRVPARARGQLGDNRRPQGARQADRGADARRRLVRPPLLAGGRRLRRSPLRPGGADPRERRALHRPRRAPKRRARRSPRRFSTACSRRRSRTSPAGRWRPPTGRPGPRTRSAATSTTPSPRPAAGCW